MATLKDLTGKKYGRWTVLRRVPYNDKANKVQWLCRCDCGEERIINSGSLLSGNSKSCGCLKREATSERIKTHGRSNERVYHIWQGIKKRCTDQNCCVFHHYGGRGISVCEEWTRFEPFFKWATENGYDDGLTIDRIDVNGDYSPGNCRWATQKEQKNNKRNNHYLVFKGERKSMARWCDELNLPYSTIRRRINAGWSAERAFTEPIRKIKRTDGGTTPQ